MFFILIVGILQPTNPASTKTSHEISPAPRYDMARWRITVAVRAGKSRPSKAVITMRGDGEIRLSLLRKDLVTNGLLIGLHK
jgi:hypothetical protein